MSDRQPTLRIRKVVIENFKIYKNKEFIFNDSRIILITGPNGFGKSTLVDAIEWCFTGDIKRLKNYFSDRNTTKAEKEREENNKGIIKNSRCKETDKIRVSLTLEINNETLEIYREQVEDSLNSNTELIYDESISKENKKLLMQLITDEFYNYNICDTLKGYNFLRNNRKDLLALFRDFLKDRPQIDKVVESLKELLSNLQTKIENEEKKITDGEKIEERRNSIKKIKEQLKKVEYPTIKIFDSEVIQVDSLSVDRLKLQRKNLNESALNNARKIMEIFIRQIKIKDKAIKYNQLKSYYYENEKSILGVIESSYYDERVLNSIETSIKNMEKIKKEIGNKTKIDDLKDIIRHKDLFKIDDVICNKIKEILKENEDHVERNKIITTMTQGNEIIEALSDIVKSKIGILKYRDEEHLECPLCGSSENFSKFTSVNEIGILANKYLEKHKSNVTDLKVKLASDKRNLDNKVASLLSELKETYQKSIEKKLLERKNFIKIHDKHQIFFEELKKEDIEITKASINELTMRLEKTNNELSSIKCTEKDKKVLEDILIINNFSLRGINFENLEDLNKLLLEIKPSCNDDLNILYFEFDIYNKKNMYINNLLSNEELKRQEKELEKWEKNNLVIKNEIEKINNKKSVIKNLINEMEDTKKKLEAEEVVTIGPYLSQIFNKIIKHSNVGEIVLKRDASREGGAVLLDGKGANLMNILSQGQLGVLMMAYFFANIFKRSQDISLKTYFIDDITSFLDDINVLSFIDMIKYILEDDNNLINQLFFSTCDENLEKLFKHKMKSFEIKGTNIKFSSYADFNIQEF